MNAQLDAAWKLLPNYLGQHLLVSLAALLLGLAVSLPLTLAAHRSPAVRWPVLTLASLIQTIPGLALLALFYPLLLALSALSVKALGAGFSALGFLPSLLSLALYAMLPILRNGVTGLAGVDPAVVEAARGMGMTEGQVLRQVELPLALPLIIAGVRLTTVISLSTAAIGSTVAAKSLGEVIIAGLLSDNAAFILQGGFIIAGLAVLIHELLSWAETRSRHA